jgi:hypothetical protein
LLQRQPQRGLALQRRELIVSRLMIKNIALLVAVFGFERGDFSSRQRSELRTGRTRYRGLARDAALQALTRQLQRLQFGVLHAESVAEHA